MSRRVQAARVAERLGSRDLDILRTLQEFRLLSGSQIRRLYFPGTHLPTQSRKARSTLHRLATFNLIIRLPRRIGGVHAGSEGFIYGLSGLGYAVLDLGESDPRRHRSISTTKPAFEAHALAVSELVVTLSERSRRESFTIQELSGEPRCWRRFSGMGGEIRILKPDAYVRLVLGYFESTAFIELDMSSESLPTISRKCSTYIDYWRPIQKPTSSNTGR